ncbi:hypothetical protein ACFFX1_41715 [Dactylosporangium sucinum]|uniref:Uncharacterized protein n=1 Tax=Dactylosporangium sucinum TaxID=1424081 RepID=A0A917U5E1_9ACTN|nr:hypothetical protein [Dactylosporangium sucinum]GGM59107.1 hypothetical protein GCM10007977_070780 [Dactylosporangium sucinum]
MASNLECVGLALDQRDLYDLIEPALPSAEVLGRRGELIVYRWQDPSGARLTVATRGGAVVDLLPTFAAEPGATLAQVRAANDDVALADVLGSDGTLATKIAAEFEQRHFLPKAGRASIVALGVDVTVHASAAEFAASEASLLSPGNEDPGPAPAHCAERGWPWPPRMAPDSFISYGQFARDGPAEAYARLHGVVLSADVRTVAATGQRFVAARVRTVGFEAVVCLPADADAAPPPPGGVVGGTVFLTGSIDGAPRRSWLPWKKR